MLYFIKKIRRDWNGRLYSTSYFNECVLSFGAKCFASRFEFEDAQQQRNYIAENSNCANPFITLEIMEADSTTYIMPPDKVLTRDYYHDEYQKRGGGQMG